LVRWTATTAGDLVAPLVLEAQRVDFGTKPNESVFISPTSLSKSADVILKLIRRSGLTVFWWQPEIGLIARRVELRISPDGKGRIVGGG